MKIIPKQSRLARLLIGTEYRGYIGVLNQYNESMLNSFKAEGKQAVQRAKAYKDRMHYAIQTGDFVIPPGKYRLLRPLMKIAQEMSDHHPELLWTIFSTMRVSDLALPSEKQIEKDLDEFKSKYLSTAPGNYTPSEFPREEFRDYLSKVIPRMKSERVFISIPLQYSARMLAKKATVRYTGDTLSRKSDRPANVTRTLPSIVGSQYEYSHIETQLPEYKDRILSFANSIASAVARESSKFSWPLSESDYETSQYQVSLRRTVAFGAGGYKTRVIGIGDYPVQYALSPLHDYIMTALSRINHDFASDHSKGFDLLQRIASKENAWVAGLDLSSATDAFPASVQADVLSAIFDNHLSEDWLYLMTGIPFENQYYKIGQPMGMLSSWVTFALAHHLIVGFAHSRINRRVYTLNQIPLETYAIVGDDIYISDPKLAHEYSKLMNTTGVAVNLTKSMTLDDKNGLCEFVKRVTWRGREISGISPNLIEKAYNGEYASLNSLLKIIKDRNYSIDTKRLLDDIMSKSNPKVKLWISTNHDIPIEIGGLSIDDASVSTVPPLDFFAALATYTLSTIKYAYRGELISNTGILVADELSYWQSRIEDILHTSDIPMISYQRERARSEEELISLNQRLLNVWDQLYQKYKSDLSGILLDPDYQQFLETLKENDGMFYQQSSIRTLVLRDFINRRDRILRRLEKGENIVFTDAGSGRIDEDLYADLFSQIDEKPDPDIESGDDTNRIVTSDPERQRLFEGLETSIDRIFPKSYIFLSKPIED